MAQLEVKRNTTGLRDLRLDPEPLHSCNSRIIEKSKIYRRIYFEALDLAIKERLINIQEHVQF